MRRFTIAALACLGFCLQAAGPRAELYQWTDERGQVHVTDDGAKVPTGQSITLRPQSPGALDKADREEAHSLALGAVAPTRAAPVREHVLLFQSSGHEISLDVSLEDRLVCNFKADTGASLNTLPRWAADELGVEIDEDTPRISVVGVSGQPMRVPVVMIASLRIGTLYAENVEMAVLDTMSSGLLGMPFWNRYRVAIDPELGELRLSELDPGSVQGVFGGVAAESWRKRFEQIDRQLAALQKARDSVPPESETQAQRYLERLDREEQKLQRQLEELESRAQAAGVPDRLR